MLGLLTISKGVLLNIFLIVNTPKSLLQEGIIVIILFIMRDFRPQPKQFKEKRR